MENNIENKTKFFAAHIGCDVVYTGAGKVIKSLGKRLTLNYENLDKLQQIVFSNQRAIELKPLSSITDEDYKSVVSNAKMNPENPEDHFQLEGRIGGIHLSDLMCGDFLRSKGYFLPYMDLTEENALKYGWIKFKTL